MNRLILLLLPGLFCIFVAQSDNSGDDLFNDANDPAVSEGGFDNASDLPPLEENSPAGNSPAGNAPAETAPAENPPQENAPTDDSFLDDLIGKEPIITQPVAPPPPPPEPAAPAPPPSTPAALPAAPSTTAPPTAAPAPAATVTSTPATKRPAAVVPGSGPDLDEPAGKPVNKQRAVPGIMTSSSPEINEAKVQETPDIPLFSHKKHLEDVGAECVQCHQTLFSESVRGYKVGPSMKEICSQCHNGDIAPAEVLAGFSDEKKYVKTTMPLFSHTTHLEHTEKCDVCHKDIYGELKKIKPQPPMTICTGCHNNGKANANCRVCHVDPAKLKPKSHTARWVYRNSHGTDARYNQEQCGSCHVDRECNQCHRGQSTFKVHRPGYKLSHGMDARQHVVDCGYCHDAENSCAQCHVRNR